MKTINDYADLVKEQHALNTTIAPVETDLTSASKAYAVGQKFIHDGVLYQAKTAIAQGAALVLNTNYEAADDVSSEIEALTNEVTDMNNVLGAKNLIPFPYSRPSGYSSNGMTCTYDEDGVITVNKTAGSATAYFALYNDTLSPNVPICLEPNKNYILSLELENATDVSVYVNDGNTDIAFIRRVPTGKYEYSFTTPAVLSSLAIGLNWINTATETNAKVKPMIRLASINDSTYVPYAKTNRELTAENQTLTNNLSNEVETRATLGAHQRLDYSVESLKALNTSGTWNGSTYSLYGVDFTINSDLSISASGTPNANADLRLARGDLSGFSGMILSGNPLSDNSIASLSLYKNASPYTYYANCNDTTEKTVSEIPSGEEQILMLRIASGKTVSAKFLPLLCLASDLSRKFTPYAMTNRELTEVKTGSYTPTVTSGGTGTCSGTVIWHRIGKLVFIYASNLAITMTSTNADLVALSLPFDAESNQTIPLYYANSSFFDLSNSVGWVSPVVNAFHIMKNGNSVKGSNWGTAAVNIGFAGCYLAK